MVFLVVSLRTFFGAPSARTYIAHSAVIGFIVIEVVDVVVVAGHHFEFLLPQLLPDALQFLEHFHLFLAFNDPVLFECRL